MVQITASRQRGRHWDLSHISFKSDIMQAALDVSLHAQIPGLVSWTRASLLLAVDDTIASLMRRISRNGSDIKDVLRLEVTSQLLKPQFTQSDREYMMEGAYNVLMACRRAARQEGIYTGGNGNEKVWSLSPHTNLDHLISEGHTTSTFSQYSACLGSGRCID